MYEEKRKDNVNEEKNGVEWIVIERGKLIKLMGKMEEIKKNKYKK